MNIKEELESLKEQDIYSFILFALFKIRDNPNYSALSELSYILDKDSMLKLCEYFGGMTITIPTVEDLEYVILALLLYKYVDIENMPWEEAVRLFRDKGYSFVKIRNIYTDLYDVLKNYKITK